MILPDFQKLMAEYPYGATLYNDHDKYLGTVVGWYITREGKLGLDLQQADTRVVHVYGCRRLTMVRP